VELKVLIVDDEPGIRLVLRKIIGRLDGFVLVGEAEDGLTALRLAARYQPDIIFLDVEMPGLNGVECAKHIRALNDQTFFIFATAHQEYMSKAFEVYAADYLIKPFKNERVRQTLNRIKQFISPSTVLTSVLPQRSGNGLEKLLIRNKDGINLIDLNEIILVQREERNTVIYTAEHRFSTSETLTELEQRLDPKRFFRSHKSYIINLAMIEKIVLYGRWTYLVKLKKINQDALLTSERYSELETLFQNY